MSPEEIQNIFFIECEESLVAAETGLAACKAGEQDSDTVNGVFRAVHSIKGGAGAFGFGALQAYTHAFETLLSEVREGILPLTDALVDLLLRALDTLSDHVKAAREGGEPPFDADLIAEMEKAMTGGSAPAAQGEPATAPEPQPAPVAEAETDNPLDLDSLLDALTGPAPAASPAEPEPADEAPWTLRLRLHGGALRNGHEPMLMLRELAAQGARCIACDVEAVPPLDRFDPTEGYFGYAFLVAPEMDEAAVRHILDFVADDCDLAIGEHDPMPAVRLAAPAVPELVAAPPAAAPVVSSPPAVSAVPTAVPPAAPDAPPVASTQPAAVATPAAGAAAAGQSIRIDLAKLDRLIDQVGELVIAQAMTAQQLVGLGAVASEELNVLDSLTRDIQETAMSIRAQPIGSVFSRVPRILRELQSSTGKQVRLEVVGEGTELDKTVIERLGEPMTHLIRNAVDHGLESAEERIAAGKAPQGTLTLSAEQRSGRVHIRIADDGRGIDRARVLAKAVEKGLVSPDAQLSNEDIDQLIFAPGFSTAQTISNVSGRGVGMDVVRQNVNDLGGRITIESREGEGTTFTLSLPLTLAISDGMIVDVGDQVLVVPLTHVVESLRPGSGEIQGLGSDRQMLNVRGRFIPVVPVCEAIGASHCTGADTGVLIVVDTQASGQAALLVDGIRDQRQFVIKSLNSNYRAVEGVAGATILGDGRVALILDVDGLVSAALAPAQHARRERIAA